ncbi:hypothetical protein IMZ48_29985 [Candidatus Bathyarchaeota archaeon]|nr:hypothetical protein [Candidatus Bathyarchaeota archaeon]
MAHWCPLQNRHRTFVPLTSTSAARYRHVHPLAVHAQCGCDEGFLRLPRDIFFSSAVCWFLSGRLGFWKVVRVGGSCL